MQEGKTLLLDVKLHNQKTMKSLLSTLISCNISLLYQPQELLLLSQCYYSFMLHLLFGSITTVLKETTYPSYSAVLTYYKYIYIYNLIYSSIWNTKSCEEIFFPHMKFSANLICLLEHVVMTLSLLGSMESWLYL